MYSIYCIIFTYLKYYCNSLAAQHGNVIAISILKDLAVSSKEISQLIKPLLEQSILESSIHPHDSNEQYKLGIQYLADSEIHNYLYAALWFRKAVKQGHWQAAYQLAELYNNGNLGDKLVPLSVVYYKQALKLCQIQLINSKTQQNHTDIEDLQFTIKDIENKLNTTTISHQDMENVDLIMESKSTILPYDDEVKIISINNEEILSITNLNLLGDQLD